MNIYTLVNDNFDVFVFASIPALLEFIAGDDLRLSPDSDVEITEDMLRSEFNRTKTLQLHKHNQDYWTYMVRVHEIAKYFS